MRPKPHISHIDAAYSFLPTLADGILARTADTASLPHLRLMLPTRRSVRMMRDVFFQRTQQKATMLPRLVTIGDVDIEELNILELGYRDENFITSLPEALSPIKRQFMLAELIERRADYKGHKIMAMNLAQYLGQLLDKTYTEELPLESLSSLVDNEALAEHWQLSLDFLSIIAEYWPQILKEHGLMDAVNRKIRLMNALSDFWAQHPPAHPVIIAGANGSIKATARMMQVVAGLEKGEVVLAGLDKNLPENIWKSAEETHPQYGLKQFLSTMQLERGDVDNWHDTTEKGNARTWLASHFMLPGSHTERWQQPDTDRLQEGLKGVYLAEAASHREEAEIVALITRKAIEDKNTSIAIVAADTALAKRLSCFLEAWGIPFDDSAGGLLKDTKAARFIMAIANAIKDRFAPISLLHLLKSDYCRWAQADKGALNILDTLGLRGAKPPPGLIGLCQRLEALSLESRLKNHRPELLNALEYTKKLAVIFNDVENDAYHRADFTTQTKRLIKIAEDLAQDKTLLWAGDEGTSLSNFLNEAIEAAPLNAVYTQGEYFEILSQMMESAIVRQITRTTPRVQILGRIEQRLVDCDVIILTSLNEGTWPTAPQPDPFLSRNMQKKFGLPDPECAAGYAAHDFCQSFSKKTVYLTRALKVDGTPTVASRWLSRLQAVCGAAGLNVPPAPEAVWLKLLNNTSKIEARAKPQPRPKAALRPQDASVTDVEKWLQDAYRFYAKKLLKLTPLEGYEADISAADTGNFIHAVFADFIQKYRQGLPDDIEAELLEMGRLRIQPLLAQSPQWQYWWPSFEKAAQWFAENERSWRHDFEPSKIEESISTTLEWQGENGRPHSFKLHARADRIDKHRKTGNAAIIDYKTGKPPTRADVIKGKKPQLMLEGVILSAEKKRVGRLDFWAPSHQGISCIAGDDDVEACIGYAAESFKKLIEYYADEQTSYDPATAASGQMIYNDERAYLHLSRLDEWGVEDLSGDAGEDSDE